MSKGPVIAIDGPAGAGKSTVAKILAQDLGLRYLDTGAMYRALALKATRFEISPYDSEGCVAMLSETEIDFGSDDIKSIFLDGEEVGDHIRTPEIGEAASAIGAFPEVRAWLVQRQQAIVYDGGVVLEGRDATTVIAPTATLKIFLTASLEERAKRRLNEFKAKGMDEEFEQVRSQIEGRDHRDITRTESPLKVAADASVVETGSRHLDSIVAEIKALLSAAIGQ